MCYAIFLQIEREGSVILAYILVCLVGLSGVALGKMGNFLMLTHNVDPTGLVLSAYLGTEDAALQTTLGLVYPLYLTGGL